MPTRTIPRPESLNGLTPMEAAAAVYLFVGAPQTAGTWEIEPFTVSEQDGAFDFIRSFGDGGGRFTPPGDHYIALRNTDPDAGYSTMMSNTRNELEDHEAFMEAAHGRVLVHGLGLSCIVSGLLANPAVERIDVVELDPDVIAMVGPAYANEDRVHIVQGDAMTYEWSPDDSWDFAWHDIWATINDKNLVSNDAEYGIGYDSLLDRFADRATYQGAWALDRALLMSAAFDLADEQAAEWEQRWREAPDADARYEILIDWHSQENPMLKGLREAKGADGPAPEQARAGMRFLIDSNPGMKADFEKAADKREIKFLIDAPPLIREVEHRLPELMQTYLDGVNLSYDEETGLALTNVLQKSEA